MSAAITKPDMDARHVSSETISSKSEIYGGITVYLKKFNKRIEVLNYITFFVILPKSRRTRAPVLGRRRTFVRSGPRRTKDEKHPPDSGTDSKLRNLRPGQNSNLMKFFNKSMIWRWKIENEKLVTKIRFKIFSSKFSLLDLRFNSSHEFIRIYIFEQSLSRNE